MSGIFTDLEAGRKNVFFGIALFFLLGVVVGLPLTIDFFGGSMLTAEQYGTWKVVHGYGVFLGFINYFFGLNIDRLRLTKREKLVSSWSMLCAGLIGGVVRMALVLLSALDDFGLYASLGEVAFITIGTAIFVIGQVRGAMGEKTVAAQSPGSLRTSPR